MIKLGILGSTRGTNLLAIIEAINNQSLAASIDLVISNKPNAMILERAKKHGIKTEVILPKKIDSAISQLETRNAYDEQISTLLKEHQIELVVLIGYMRILSANFVKTWKKKIINIHPSLLPDFAGKMDLAVHQAVLEAGVSETGCTVHYVTEEVDGGPILLQKRCEVVPGESAELLKSRVQALEGSALIEVIKLHCSLV
jgi:phosphoribosylglycinamide formyltransferase-1